MFESASWSGSADLEHLWCSPARIAAGIERAQPRLLPSAGSGRPVAQDLGVAVEGVGIEQFEVEVVRAGEDAVHAGRSGDHREDR